MQSLLALHDERYMDAKKYKFSKDVFHYGVTVQGTAEQSCKKKTIFFTRIFVMFLHLIAELKHD